jgi:ABC-type transport system involved in cytochrome bd biosynthesis fused ATPase/permease subunit
VLNVLQIVKIQTDALQAIEAAKDQAVEDVTELHKKTMSRLHQKHAEGEVAKEKSAQLAAQLSLEKQEQELKVHTLRDSADLEQKAVQQEEVQEAAQLDGLNSAVTDEEGAHHSQLTASASAADAVGGAQLKY